MDYGLHFYANVPGNITKVRIYTGPAEGGSHTVRIWRYLPEGEPTLIAGPYTWTFSSGTEGWKTYTLPSPVSITPYVKYIASVSPGFDGTNYYVSETQWGPNSFEYHSK